MEMLILNENKPQPITWNYTELKSELTTSLAKYDVVYTDMAEAKRDKASLNKLAKAINDKKIAVKKECLAPYNNFEVECKDIIGMIADGSSKIDKQVKAYEESKKQEKKAEIETYFAETNVVPWLELDMIFMQEWLNASVNIKTIKASIDDAISKTKTEIDLIDAMPYASFAMDVYRDTLSLHRAIAENNRIERLKADEERRAVEREQQERAKEIASEVPEPIIDEVVEPLPFEAQSWVKFEVLVTMKQAIALREWLDAKGLEFRGC